VAILFDRLGPYHVARIAAAAELYPTIAIEFGSESSTYAWDHVATEAFLRHTIVSGARAEDVSRANFARDLFEVLERQRPSVIALPGWYHFGSLLALAWARWRGAVTVMMSETQADDEARQWLKERIKRRVLGLCSSALVGGVRHFAYAKELGMPEERTFLGYDVVDNDYFASRADAVRQDADAHRARLGLPPRFFIASNRFIPKKNLFTLMRAYARYRGETTGESVALVILGDGPLRADLESLRSELGLEAKVLLPGFQQYEEIPTYYGLAEAFVHASTVEQWGLVVNEAAAAALPLLVSRHCGCSPELVREGENGYTFDPHDEIGLSARLRELAGDAGKRRRFGIRSREIVSAFSPRFFAEQLRRAAQSAPTLPRTGAVDWALLTALSLR
jgi:1,2-diacylglycerol 3-alpha-glucosyltransferase